MAKETKVKEYKEEAEKLNQPTNADALRNVLPKNSDNLKISVVYTNEALPDNHE